MSQTNKNPPNCTLSMYVFLSYLCLNLVSICLVLSYLLGTSVPNLGALLGMLIVVGLEPGLDDGDESILPLD